MKAMISAAFVMAFVLLPASRGRAQLNATERGILIAPTTNRTVTVTRNGALLTSLTIPKEMITCASYEEPPVTISADRWEFFGDFVLRAQPAGKPSPGWDAENRTDAAPSPPGPDASQRERCD